ncbi:MAG: hypothetical protein WBE72_22300 [Terracidiphilus sp.]
MTVAMEQVWSDAGPAAEGVLLLKEREERLLVMIGELLKTNEELRLKLARLEAQSGDAFKPI